MIRLCSSHFQIPGLALHLWDTDYDWKYHAERSENYSQALNTGTVWTRGKMLGGCGGLNVMIYLRGFPKDYDTWQTLGNDGWGYSDVERIFDKMENDQALNRNGENSSYGPLKLNYFRDNGDPIRKVIVDGVKARGYNWVKDFNTGNDKIGLTNIYGNFDKGIRQSSARAYLIPAGNRKNLHVVKNAQVTGLKFDNDRVEEVEFTKDGKCYQVTTDREVILSGGAIGSPQILMQSGIGPRDHLEEIGIKPIKDLPVGKNLQDHIYVPMVFQFSEYVGVEPEGQGLNNLYQYFSNRTGPLALLNLGLVGFINTKDVHADHPNIELIHAFFPRNSGVAIEKYGKLRQIKQNYTDQVVGINKEMTVVEFGLVLINPESRGEIKLRNNDPNSKPRIYPNYLSREADVETLVEALKFYHDLQETRAFKAAGGTFVKYKDLKCNGYPTEEYWKCYVRHFSTTLYHPVGTAKMGPKSDPEAVVDAELRVRGVENLRVCDASIMPKIVSVNTNPASMMIGEKCAEIIKEKYETIYMCSGRSPSYRQRSGCAPARRIGSGEDRLRGG